LLDVSAVAAQLARDHREAKNAPSGAAFERLQELFLDNGRGELEPFVDVQAVEQRLREAAKILGQLKKVHGETTEASLRAAACERLESVMDGEITGETKDAWLGLFANLLDRHHATLQGIPVAPHFVIRTLYKARWNTLHGLPHAQGFTPVEGQAYFGWLALHADGLPLQQRLQAIPEYESAGGKRVHEAAGVLLFLVGHFKEASEALQKAYDQEPSLRLRNYLLFAQGQIRQAD